MAIATRRSDPTRSANRYTSVLQAIWRQEDYHYPCFTSNNNPTPPFGTCGFLNSSRFVEAADVNAPPEILSLPTPYHNMLHTDLTNSCDRTLYWRYIADSTLRGGGGLHYWGCCLLHLLHLRYTRTVLYYYGI